MGNLKSKTSLEKGVCATRRLTLIIVKTTLPTQCAGKSASVGVQDGRGLWVQVIVRKVTSFLLVLKSAYEPTEFCVYLAKQMKVK